MKEFKPPWGGSWAVKNGIIQSLDGKPIGRKDRETLKSLGYSVKETPKKKEEK